MVEAHALFDIRASFYNGEGQSPWRFLVFQCLSLGVPSLCLGTSEKGGAEVPTLPIYIAFCYRLELVEFAPN